MPKRTDDHALIISADMPKLPPGNWTLVTGAWGKNVSPDDRDAIDRENETVAKIASGEIFEDGLGRRWKRVDGDI